MKILHLEDNLHDAELSHALVLGEWPDCKIQVVDNRKDFEGNLSEECDLILSDFNMPAFNGLEALKIARERAPNTPFIFMSGTIGEERAIEALRSGASDYVIKDRPQRLVATIRRALKDVRMLREKKEADEHLLRVQRLENIGMLASGIAHDFNNVLAPIEMGISVLRTRHPGELDQKMFANIQNCARRGAGLVKQIMGFAKGVSGEPQLLDVRHLIREVVSMAEQTFPRTIRIEHMLAADLVPLKANPTQLHQVLLNLCVNARDAMPSGGTLAIRARNGELEVGVLPCEHIVIEVSDTGTGIPAEVVERIWEPFFTTKEVGKGTGLGLSTVRSIVQNHQGVITLDTAPGGTTFRVYLPSSTG
ncbi:MAG: hybrid sensor histidine kinase/response regulator [Verrucomicrobia bacterium]|nr:hybrid sensor histidine kinase/response regulator [Verrucomicrobiota bacterium]